MHLRSARFDSNLRFVMALGVAALIWGAAPDRASAQTPSIMAPGDTIVTGFSGVLPPVPPFPPATRSTRPSSISTARRCRFSGRSRPRRLPGN